jgi:hypothetical protein
VRGTPQQIIDKYQQLHRDATLSNDRVAAENFAQHAEHYARMLGEAMRVQEARPKAQDEQHRERQNEREEQQQANQAKQQQQREEQQSQPRQDEQPQPRRDEQPQPSAPVDVIESDSSDSGLVETVENAPKPRKPRTRKPRAKPTEEAATPAPETDQSAAE